jgi:hypothetical protein
MRGDSDDTAFARYAMASVIIWFIVAFTATIFQWWFLAGFCLGMPFAIFLFILTLYKDWWPNGFRIQDFFKVL